MSITRAEKIRNAIYRLRRKGRDAQGISYHLTAACGIHVSVGEVEATWQEMIVSGWVKRKRDAEANSNKRGAAIYGEDTAQMKARLREASILHLLDLKRAGHSPTRTEYVIESEGKGVRFPKADVSSYIGSAAGLCAESV